MSDLTGFLAINGLAGRSVALDAFFIFGASWLPFVMVASVLGYVAVSWKTSHFEGRFENAIEAFWSVATGFVAEQVIGFLWFRARPFVALEEAVKLIDRFPHEKSFPSGHATFAFALAVSLLLRNRRWGWPLAIMACLVALSRVFVGVHYPSDVLAGAVVGSLAALAAAPVKKKIEPYLDLFPVFRMYKRKDA